MIPWKKSAIGGYLLSMTLGYHGGTLMLSLKDCDAGASKKSRLSCIIQWDLFENNIFMVSAPPLTHTYTMYPKMNSSDSPLLYGIFQLIVFHLL